MPSALQSLRARQRLLAWLGLLALCAQLLAGVASQWHQLQRLTLPPSLLALCSSSGITADPSLPDNNPTHGSAAQHCAFCLAAQALSLEAPRTVAWRPAEAPDHPVPPAWADGLAHRPPELRHAPPRAPPSLA